MSVPQMSKSLFDYIKRIGEARFKNTEKGVMRKELTDLKKKCEGFNKLNEKALGELMIRLIYSDLLGYDIKFGHFAVVQACANSNPFVKQLAFLALTQFFSPEHEFSVLTIASIQDDLETNSPCAINTALTALANVANTQYLPSLIPQVLQLLSHRDDSVVIHALNTLTLVFDRYETDDALIFFSDNIGELNRCLSHSNLMVVNGVLEVFKGVAKLDASLLYDGVGTICNQMTEILHSRTLPKNNYHNITAPWFICTGLELLGLICKDNHEHSNKVYQVLSLLYRQYAKSLPDTTENSLFAIFYAFCFCVSQIYPSDAYLQNANEIVTIFLAHNAARVKYLGLKALDLLLCQDSAIALRHQESILEALDSEDITLRQLSFELLFKIADGTNIEHISKRFRAFIKLEFNAESKMSLMLQYAGLCSRLAPSGEWYIEAISILLAYAPENSSEQHLEELATALSTVLKDGTGDAVTDDQLRDFAVDFFAQTILNQNGSITPTMINSYLLRVFFFVFAEYSAYATNIEDVNNAISVALRLPAAYQSAEALAVVIDLIVVMLDRVELDIDSVISSITRARALLDKTPLLDSAYKRFRAVIDRRTANLYQTPQFSAVFDVSVLEQFTVAALDGGEDEYVSRDERDHLSVAMQVENVRFEAEPSTEKKPEPTRATITAKATASNDGGLFSGLAVSGPWGSKTEAAKPKEESPEKPKPKTNLFEGLMGSPVSSKEEAPKPKRDMDLFGSLASPVEKVTEISSVKVEEKPKKGLLDFLDTPVVANEPTPASVVESPVPKPKPKKNDLFDLLGTAPKNNSPVQPVTQPTPKKTNTKDLLDFFD
ncbi:hypothetical protein PCE1_001458 [Barthelona sp. PCE]